MLYLCILLCRFATNYKYVNFLYVSKVLSFSWETCQMTDDKFWGWFSMKVRIPAFVCNKLKSKHYTPARYPALTQQFCAAKWNDQQDHLFCRFSLLYVWKVLWSETEIIRNQEEKTSTQPFYTSLRNAILLISSSKFVVSHLICISREIQNFANTQKGFIFVICTKFWENIFSKKPW